MGLQRSRRGYREIEIVGTEREIDRGEKERERRREMGTEREREIGRFIINSLLYINFIMECKIYNIFNVILTIILLIN